jgi:hypothetical protein
MKYFFSLFLAILIVAAILKPAGALENDGFIASSTIEGEHLSVQYQEGVDLNTILDQLKISSVDEQLTNIKIDRSSAQRQLLSKLEILFSRSGDLMDMHIYSYKGAIKVFTNHQKLQEFFKSLFKDNELPCTGYSFYSADYNSIYISSENFKREIIGHELGHAIMTHYFVVQPSIKIQEVLAGYIEFQLRKTVE